MGLRAINNPKSSFEDPYANTGRGAVTAAPPGGVIATGGNVTSEPGNGYKYHIFTSPGSLVVSESGPGAVEYLVVD